MMSMTFFSMQPAAADNTIKVTSAPSFGKRLFKNFFSFLFFLIILAVITLLATVLAGFFTALGANIANTDASLLAVVLAFVMAKITELNGPQAYLYLIVAVLFSFVFDFPIVAITLILLPQILKKFKFV